MICAVNDKISVLASAVCTILGFNTTSTTLHTFPSKIIAGILLSLSYRILPILIGILSPG